MEDEVFAGRTAEEFESVIARLRAEGRTKEADQVAYLLGAWLSSHGRLPDAPPSGGAAPEAPLP